MREQLIEGQVGPILVGPSLRVPLLGGSPAGLLVVQCPLQDSASDASVCQAAQAAR